ncbi:MAG TPA: CsbD family protein [Stellaceae bacterium]|jgi:uncharacterized protein YjbJ (UPF0337 family)|nr:CsbD family protein [Stellaceae bacterium]
MTATAFEGTIRSMAGKMQETVGNATGDRMTLFRGKLNQAAGQMQEAYGNALGEARSFTSERPLTAVLAALGVGVLIGAIAAGRR